MAAKLVMDLPVADLDRAQEFHSPPGSAAAAGMASINISQDAQVMLWTAPVFASHTRRQVADAAPSTQVILVLGLEDRACFDRVLDTPLASAAPAAGSPQDSDGRHQRSFFDRGPSMRSAVPGLAPQVKRRARRSLGATASPSLPITWSR